MNTQGEKSVFGFEKMDGVMILRVMQRHATVDLVDELKNWLTGESQKGNIKIVADLRDVDFVDSSFVGALVSGLKNLRVVKGDLKVVGLRPTVRTIFEITRLNELFEIFSDMGEAVQSFSVK